MWTVVNHEDAVDQEVRHTFRVLMQILERSAAEDSLGIQSHDVSEVSGVKQATVGESEPLRGRARHLAHRVLQGEPAALADVAAKRPSERPVFAGMRDAIAQHGHPTVGPDSSDGVAHDALDILLGHRSSRGRSPAPPRAR